MSPTKIGEDRVGLLLFPGEQGGLEEGLPVREQPVEAGLRRAETGRGGLDPGNGRNHPYRARFVGFESREE